MKTEEVLKLKGSVKVILRDANGNIKQQHENHNLVVTVGKNYLATWLAAATQSGPFMSYVGLGTSSTAAASGDTTLGAESVVGGYSRQQGTLTHSTNTWTNTVTFAAGNGTDAITEAGLFSASTSGTLFAHQVFFVYNKASGDSMQFVWTVTFN